MSEENALSALEAEDMIVARFCETHGGIEYAMPMIREAFKKADASFAEPSREELVKVVEHLNRINESFKGADVARGEKSFFSRILRRIG